MRLELEYEEEFDEDDFEYGEHALDEFVLFCDTTNCVMPGPHYLSECCTPEMIDHQEEE